MSDIFDSTNIQALWQSYVNQLAKRFCGVTLLNECSQKYVNIESSQTALYFLQVLTLSRYELFSDADFARAIYHIRFLLPPVAATLASHSMPLSYSPLLGSNGPSYSKQRIVFERTKGKCYLCQKPMRFEDYLGFNAQREACTTTLNDCVADIFCDRLRGILIMLFQNQRTQCLIIFIFFQHT